MNRYKITIVVESEEDPSSILDGVTHAIEQGYTNVEMSLDSEAEEDGCAVSVESVG